MGYGFPTYQFSVALTAANPSSGYLSSYDPPINIYPLSLFFPHKIHHKWWVDVPSSMIFFTYVEWYITAFRERSYHLSIMPR